MCCRRQVRTIYRQCGHAVTAPDEEIKCTSTKCIFSPNHPSTCSGQVCKLGCWQYRSSPQQYAEWKDLFCPRCQRAGYQ